MEVTLVEGQSQTLEVVLSRPPQAEPTTTPEDAEPQSDHDGWGAREIVMVGGVAVSVAGLATGIGFTIAESAAADRIERAQKIVDATAPEDPENACEDNPLPECSELRDALDDQKRASRFATIGFVAAGVGAAATLATWVLWPSSRDRVSASVSPSPGGATLSLAGRF
jgi:hypothetical protein